MATSCDCPEPPGGRVVCTDGAYAYCRVIAGRATTGCLPVPHRQTDKPTVKNIVERLDWTFQRIGFIDSSGVELVVGGRPMPIVQARYEVSEYLYLSMRSGRPVTLQGMIHDEDDDFTDMSKVHLRFPSVWADGEQNTRMLRSHEE